MTLSEHPCDICGEQVLYSGTVKVWQLQHQISRCCADIFTVSAREVCLREPLCFSWRLQEAYGLSKDAMKPSARTMQAARVVTPWKLNQKSIVSTFAKGNTTGDPDLVDLVAKTDWILPEARGQIAQRAAGKKSRASGLVHECHDEGNLHTR